MPPKDRRKPFGSSLEIERDGDDQLAGWIKRSPRTSSADEAAGNVAQRGLDEIDRLPVKTRVLIQIVVGGLGVAAAWLIKLSGPRLLADPSRLTQHEWFLAGAFGFAALAANGVLQLVFRAPPAPSPGQRFGVYTEGQRAETLWRMRLVAIAIGLLHAGIVAWT